MTAYLNILYLLVELATPEGRLNKVAQDNRIGPDQYLKVLLQLQVHVQEGVGDPDERDDGQWRFVVRIRHVPKGTVSPRESVR